jgi:hypothetical protein
MPRLVGHVEDRRAGTDEKRHEGVAKVVRAHVLRPGRHYSGSKVPAAPVAVVIVGPGPAVSSFEKQSGLGRMTARPPVSGEILR